MTENRIAQAVVRFVRARGERGLVAVRVTGTPRLGGIWQCYVPVPSRLVAVQS